MQHPRGLKPYTRMLTLGLSITVGRGSTNDCDVRKGPHPGEGSFLRKTGNRPLMAFAAFLYCGPIQPGATARAHTRYPHAHLVNGSERSSDNRE